MFIRKLTRKKDGKTHAYWALVESYRTARGPRQRIVSYLGEIDTGGRLGVRLADSDKQRQRELFEEQTPKWVAVDIKAVRTERTRDFGDVWLCLQLIERLGLRRFLTDLFAHGREKIRWADLALVLVIARFCDPKSELYIAEHFYGHTAREDLIAPWINSCRTKQLCNAISKNASKPSSVSNTTFCFTLSPPPILKAKPEKIRRPNAAILVTSVPT